MICKISNSHYRRRGSAKAPVRLSLSLCSLGIKYTCLEARHFKSHYPGIFTSKIEDQKTRKTKSILLYVNFFQFTIYVFIGIDDKRKNHANNRLDYNANQIYDKTI